jgi:PleD family two-component response regulator
VTDLEADMAKEEGTLEGGVSVGAAVRRPRHDDPEALRTDATEALREAYKTGTCTVVA